MKKLRLAALILLTITLSACSFFEEVNTSLDYVNTATEHIQNLTTFAEEAPQLIESALNNPEILQELESQVITLKADIEEFIALNDIPTIAKDIHQELVTRNEQLLQEINKVLENGHLALDKLESSQLFTTINEVTSLMNRIENLTQ
jgi:PBP1b-binding outer membrane lipoprotein LpoB